MQRRGFLFATGAIFFSSALEIRAGHHVISAEPLIVESDLGTLAGRYTPIEDFYVRNHFPVPVAPLDPLTIEGQVAKPGKFTSQDFLPISLREFGAVLECAGGPLRPNTLTSAGVWRGWPLREIIALASPQAGARYAHLVGGDGFCRSVPVDRLYHDALLATSLNGRPLGRNHGRPWRALFPGWYGMDSVKWLSKIVLAETPLPPLDASYLQTIRLPDGATERQPLPPIQIKSVITRPPDGAVLPQGSLEVGGLAWSGVAQASRVEVSADNGASWRKAVLSSVPGPYDWVAWRTSITLDRTGVVNLVAKATDSAGNTQPEKWDPRRSDLYAYNVWHRIRCVVA